MIIMVTLMIYMIMMKMLYKKYNYIHGVYRLNEIILL